MTTPRLESLPAMLLAGLRRHHSMVDAPQAIGRQWGEFNRTALRHTSVIRYGVTCAFDGAAQRLEYLCAVEVASFDGVPEGIGRVRVPASPYAVFDVPDPPSAIPLVWGQAMQWEATNGCWRDAHTPSFERYDGEACTIWLPVVRREGTA